LSIKSISKVSKVQQDICIVLYTESDSPVRRPGMATANERSRCFTCHRHEHPKWNQPCLPLLPSSTASS